MDGSHTIQLKVSITLVNKTYDFLRIPQLDTFAICSDIQDRLERHLVDVHGLL